MPFIHPFISYAPSRCYRTVPVRRDITPFLSLLSQGLNEIEQAQNFYQARKPFVPRFDVWESEDSYQVEGELPGINQKDIDITLTDEHNLIIKGQLDPSSDSTSTTAQGPSSSNTESEKKQDLAAEEPAHTETESETESLPSYQATVEDDFEDLAESSEIASIHSSNKGKEKAVEPAEVSEPVKPQQETEQQQTSQQRRWVSERSYGSFSRSFRFAARVDAEAVTASLKNGVLSIVVPKAPVPEQRTIKIE